MKKSRLTESQIVATLKEVEAGLKLAPAFRSHGISSPTHYNCRSKCGGMEAPDVKRLKERKLANSGLKKWLALSSLAQLLCLGFSNQEEPRKGKRFTEEPIIRILHEATGRTVSGGYMP